jgi:hypothetical protein
MICFDKIHTDVMGLNGAAITTTWLDCVNTALTLIKARSHTHTHTHTHTPDLWKAVAWVNIDGLQYYGSAPVNSNSYGRLHAKQFNNLTQPGTWKWAIEQLEWTIAPDLLAQHIQDGTAKAIPMALIKTRKEWLLLPS